MPAPAAWNAVAAAAWAFCFVKETANPMSRTQRVEVRMHTAVRLLGFRCGPCTSQRGKKGLDTLRGFKDLGQDSKLF